MPNDVVYDIIDSDVPKKKGGTRKIGDIKRAWCGHPEHNPASHQVFPDGVYEHECPGCGAKQRFVVSKPTW